jgi:hypothetical protein
VISSFGRLGIGDWFLVIQMEVQIILCSGNDV